MKEIISFHVGQAGVQLGCACWELYCLEHGINPCGRLVQDADAFDPTFKCIFHQTESEKYVPRSILVDLEPTVVDEVRTGTYRELHNPVRIVNKEEDAANNFARGRYTIGRQIIDHLMEISRKTVEECDFAQGFMLFHSMGGGTGSGLLSFICEQLLNEFPKKSRVQFSIYPSPSYASAVTEPYNAVLATNETLETSDLALMLDNESLYDIIRRVLYQDRPTFSTINRILAQVISTITAPMRFDGPLNSDLTEFETNLVPYPRIHFPLTTYAPFQTMETHDYQSNTVYDLTKNCFQASSRLLQVDPREGKYMAVSLLYRGQCLPKEVNDAINEIKSNTSVQFVDWCPTGFKVGINSSRPTCVPGTELKPCDRALCMLSNSTVLEQSFNSLMTKFAMLHSRRAFVHWYVGEGMEESELVEASKGIAQLQMDYREIGMSSAPLNPPISPQMIQEGHDPRIQHIEGQPCPCPVY